MLAENIKALSKSEKLLLINDLWEDVSEDTGEIPLSDEQKEMLDSRYKAFLAAPEEGTPWTEVKMNLKKTSVNYELIIRNQAQCDIAEILRNYEEKEKGLGAYFLLCLDAINPVKKQMTFCFVYA
jgi:putative addiction module component (TIGR02574 family)